jgi:hypothetical protein
MRDSRDMHQSLGHRLPDTDPSSSSDRRTVKLVVQELIVDAPAQVRYELLTADVEIPPGSTTVEIDLTAIRGTTTPLRLVHRGLDDLAAGARHGGWSHYLDRPRHCAQGFAPGPDPVVAERVPTPAELRR